MAVQLIFAILGSPPEVIFMDVRSPAAKHWVFGRVRGPEATGGVRVPVDSACNACVADVATVDARWFWVSSDGEYVIAGATGVDIEEDV